YRLGLPFAGTHSGGLAVASAYLLAPMGQWAALSDFHTTAFATPLLLLSMERLYAGKPAAGVLAAAVALTAREDVAASVAVIGLGVALSGRKSLGLALTTLAASWAAVCLLMIHSYSGTLLSFTIRYEA